MFHKRSTRLMGAILALMAVATPRFALAEAAGQWKSGEQIYAQTCAYCHNAGVGPNLLGRSLSPELVQHVVYSGLSAMPAFRPTDFNAKEVAQLGAWIRDSKAPPAPPNAPTTPEGTK